MLKDFQTLVIFALLFLIGCRLCWLLYAH